MQVDQNSFSSNLAGKKSNSASTASSKSSAMEVQVSEFSFDDQLMSLAKKIGRACLDEKQNEKHATDRFIPMRKVSSLNSDPKTLKQSQKKNEQNDVRGKQIVQQKMTLDEMYRILMLQTPQDKLLNFTQKKTSFMDTKDENSCLGINGKNFKKHSTEFRKIQKVPFKVLDAPNLQDDFYLNLLEWSSSNILSVALQSSLYFWNGNNNKVLRFCDLNPNTITSLTWNLQGNQLCIGTSLGTVEVWDATKNVKTQTLLGHTSRVSSLAWSYNTLASGSRDRSINIRDIRAPSNGVVETYEGHTQQVCGLKWSFDGHSLASGGNDNKLLVWSTRSNIPTNRFTAHTAAVKGIAWSPHNHGLLASGGGSVDRTIKFWNTLDNTLLDSIDTGSQVCNLMFSKTTKEIVSTHGFSNNQITVWKYPTLQKTVTLTGHSSRVLYLAMSPSGQNIVTGAGDETLRFWNVFPGKKSQYQNKKFQGLTSMELR